MLAEAIHCTWEDSMMRSPGVLWIKAAVVYLMMGVGLSGDRCHRAGFTIF